MEEDDVENSGFGISMGMGGRGRGMRSGGPGRRVMKLGVGGFFVKVFLFCMDNKMNNPSFSNLCSTHANKLVQVPRHRLSNAEDESGIEEDSVKPKIKRFRKPRRSQLEDNYPPVIQVTQ